MIQHLCHNALSLLIHKQSEKNSYKNELKFRIVLGLKRQQQNTLSNVIFSEIHNTRRRFLKLF